jgi:nitrogen fixation NifU-like protein
MDLNDLYRDVIVDHNRSPRNFRQIEPPRREADGFNPLCGDKLHVYLRISDDRIEDAAFEGSGCAISKGKTEAEALDLFERMHELLTGEEADLGELASLGKLAALSGVRQYPTRVKCASLCWHTMKSALAGGDAVSTE